MISAKRIVAQAKLRFERARADHGVFDIAVRTFKRYSEDDGGSYAASLTYFTFFSIFPLLLFSVSILGYLTFVNPELRADLLRSGLEAFPVVGSILTNDSLDTIEAHRGSLALTGIILALYSGSGAVVALEHALNKVARVDNDPPFLEKRLRSLKWLAILGLSGMLSVALGGVTNYAAGFFGQTGAEDEVARLLGHAGGISVSLLLFMTSFRFLPALERRWRDVLPGALIAATGFELLKVFGSWYLERGSATREATFGAFTAAAGLLVACYLLSQVILLSAEANAVLFERRAVRQSESA